MGDYLCKSCGRQSLDEGDNAISTAIKMLAKSNGWHPDFRQRKGSSAYASSAELPPPRIPDSNIFVDLESGLEKPHLDESDRMNYSYDDINAPSKGTTVAYSYQGGLFSTWSSQQVIFLTVGVMIFILFLYYGVIHYPSPEASPVFEEDQKLGLIRKFRTEK